MFHRAIDLKFTGDTEVEVTFRNGKVMRYDVSELFDKIPPLSSLRNRSLFTSGYLSPGGYGIIWNDDLDLDIETIYYDGHLIKTLSLPGIAAGEEVQRVRAEAGLSQKELADLTGIDQSDISKIERGASNPTLGTLERIANALGGKLVISIETEH